MSDGPRSDDLQGLERAVRAATDAIWAAEGEVAVPASHRKALAAFGEVRIARSVVVEINYNGRILKAVSARDESVRR